MKKQKEPTDNVTFEQATFCLSTANKMLLEAYQKYAQYLDLILDTKPDECVGNDLNGILNYLLETSLNKELKDIQKKHGFDNFQEMITNLLQCTCAEEVEAEIRTSELKAHEKTHQKILDQIPVEDRQLKLFTTDIKEAK